MEAIGRLPPEVERRDDHDQALPLPSYGAGGEEGFALEDLMGALGALEFHAVGYVKHGDVLKEDG